MKRIKIPLIKKDIEKLKVGDKVLISGVIYTARDQAHKRLCNLINNKKRLPFNLKDQIIYYCGPTATPPGKVIGSCGPTTSLRMDKFIGPLLKKGLLVMIGKGERSKEARNLIRKNKGVYFVAPSGCGALLAKKVFAKKIVCFSHLGAEAVYRLEVKDFPLIVAIDSKGGSIYK